MSSGKIVEVNFLDLGDFVETGGNYLLLRDDVPNEALVGVFGRLKTIGGVLHWYVGDFFSQVATLRGSEFANQVMEEWEYSYARASACKRVACAYDVSMRRPELSFSHHEEALVLCDSIEDALELLEQASIGSWSVATMRKQFATKGQAPQSLPSKLFNLQPVYDVLRWCSKTDPASLSPDVRQQIKEEVAPLVEWASKL